MTVMEKGPAQRPAYADGKTKLMLIDGRWVRGGVGQDLREPQSGDRRAAGARRRRRQGGHRPRRRRGAQGLRRARGASASRPSGRQLLLKLADLVEQHFEELAPLDTLDMGAPISRTRNNRQRAVGMLRYYAGMATAIHGETIENSLPGEIFSYTLKEPVGVVGAIIPWNGPLDRDDLEDRPGARDRLHRRAEAGRGGAADAAAAGRAVPGSRRAAGRRQRRAGLRRDRGRGARRASATSTRSPSPART